MLHQCVSGNDLSYSEYSQCLSFFLQWGKLYVVAIKQNFFHSLENLSFSNFCFTKHKGRKKLQLEDRSHVVTSLKQRDSGIAVAGDFGISK